MMSPAPAFRRAAAVALLLVSLALAAPAAAGTPQGIAILAYHRFDPATAGPTTVTTRALTAQLAWLARHGVRIVRLRDAVGTIATPGNGAMPREVAITIDDGHRSVYTVLFPLIRKLGVPVTLFIYPSAIGRASYALTWAQLREMQASGLVDVQSHTYWHPNFTIERRRLSATDFQRFVDNQLRRSKAVLEAQIGQPVDMLALPNGIVAPDLESAARNAGYRFAFAYEGGPARRGMDLLALPRVPVSEAVWGDGLAALVGLHATGKAP